MSKCSRYVGMKEMSVKVFWYLCLGHWAFSVMGLFPPFPFIGHSCLGYGLDSSPDLGLGQLNSCYPVGVMPATHVAYLVRPTLERRYPAANECRQEIVGCHTFVILETDDELVDLVDLGNKFLRIIIPVELRSRRADNKCRQADHVYVGRILHVEEGPEPLLARLEAVDPRKDGASPRYNCGRTALGHLFGSSGVIFIRDNLRPESKILGPKIYSWPDAEIPLRERDKSG